jgi:hypothetical protein
MPEVYVFFALRPSRAFVPRNIGQNCIIHLEAILTAKGPRKKHKECENCDLSRL